MFETRFFPPQDKALEIRRHRQRIFERMLQVVDSFTTDYQEYSRGRDVRVDPELREGLAVLLSMGINTSSSCWGHPERRDEVTEKNSGWPEYQLTPSIMIEGIEPMKNLEPMKDLSANETGEISLEDWKKILESTAHQRKILEECLQKFAEENNSAAAEYIIITGNPTGGTFWLTTVDRKKMDQKTRSEQDLFIAGAQKEWSDFLAFLKQQYLTDNTKNFIPVDVD